MAPLKLSFACWDYDRVKALEDGRVKVEGVDLNFINLRYVVCLRTRLVSRTDYNPGSKKRQCYVLPSQSNA
jgi:hypothetical protein